MTHDTFLFQDPEQVRQRQVGLLRQTLLLCASRHPYYAPILRSIGLRAEEVSSPDDLQRLPLTHKRQLMEAPQEFRLDCEDLSLAERTDWDVTYTAGTTTGKPTPFYTKAFDFYGIVLAGRRMCEIRGITGDDLVANLFPLTHYPTGAFQRVTAASIGAGFGLMTPAPGPRHETFDIHRRTDEIVTLIARKRPTVLWGIASYIRRAALHARERGVRWPSVRMLAVSGEPIPHAMREDLRGSLRALGAPDPIISNSFGLTEIQAGLVECHEESGLHNPAPELYYFEVVDERTGRRVTDGEKGMLCLTHLNRRGTVLLRYVTGDLAVQSHARCPQCGRATDRILWGPVRTDHLIKVKATLVDPGLIVDAVAGQDGVDEYQVVIRKVNMADPLSEDEVVVRISGPGSSDPALWSGIQGRVREAVGITPVVEGVGSGEVFDPETMYKARRVVDLRPRA